MWDCDEIRYIMDTCKLPEKKACDIYVMRHIRMGESCENIAEQCNVSLNAVRTRYRKILVGWRGENVDIPEEGDVLEHLTDKYWIVTKDHPSYLSIRGISEGYKSSFRRIDKKLWMKGLAKYRHYGSPPITSDVYDKKNEKTKLKEPELYDSFVKNGNVYVIHKITDDYYYARSPVRGSRDKKIPKDYASKGYRLADYPKVGVSTLKNKEEKE